jgi:iron(III) transport system substrate-binding protein
MWRWRARWLLRLGVGSLLLLGACSAPAAAPAAAPRAPAAPPVAQATAVSTHSAGVRELIEGARSEGELQLILSPSMFDRGEALPRFQQAFNDYYGLNITFTPSFGPSQPQLAATIAQAVQAGRRSPTDVYFGSDLHIGTLLKAGALEAVDWHALDDRIPRMAIAEGNVGLAYGSSFQGIAYSQNRVAPAEAPRTLQEVLDPKWKGRVASTPYAAGFPQLARATAWGEARTTEYVRQLADHISGLIRCGEEERLLRALVPS